MTQEKPQIEIERYKIEILQLKSNIELLEKLILQMQRPSLLQPQCSLCRGGVISTTQTNT